MADGRGGGRLLPYLPGKAMMGKANTKKTVQSSTALLSQYVGLNRSPYPPRTTPYQPSYYPLPTLVPPLSYHRAADPTAAIDLAVVSRSHPFGVAGYGSS